MKKVLIPIPRKHFDPSEVAIPWKILKDGGVQVVFATPDGASGECDQIMLNGKGLGLLAPLLMADKNAKEAYGSMENSEEFNHPIKWEEVNWQEYDGLLLPGGHDKGVREYLESQVLQKMVARFFESKKPVAAICHGVVLAARSKRDNGESVLLGKKTTSLLAQQELLAYGLTCLWMKDYYRTYPQTVEAEVKEVLASRDDFLKGPPALFRDNEQKLKRGFVVRDGNYISARWPGDAHLFSKTFLEILNN